MHIQALKIEGLRCLQAVSVQPDAGVNVLIGANGSGKTSVLEALHLLTHGRSFRPGGHASLTARTGHAYSVYAEIGTVDGHTRRIGLLHDDAGWHVRLQGERASGLSEAIAACAGVCFEPGSHALIAGGSSLRRRFLDWGVFHVEHALLNHWQRYRKALQNRNSLLRQGAGDAELAAWEEPMVRSGEAMDHLRRSYAADLEPRLQSLLHALVPQLGDVQLQLRSGWSGSGSLAQALRQGRHQDRQRGHTTRGPHRADWRLQFAAAARHDQLSRGQEKLVALACVLAQAEDYADRKGDWPVICLDDLASELDSMHQQRVVDWLQGTNAQIWVTGTEVPPALVERGARMFHVEQGSIKIMS